MKQKLTTEILETEHQIAGLGKINIEYRFGDGKYYYRVQSDSMGAQIVFAGEKAKNHGLNIFKNDFPKLTPLQVKNIVCDICNVPHEELKTRTRKEEYVFGRYLAAWYFFKFGRMTKTGAGEQVGIDHATAMRGIKIIQSCIDDELCLKGLKPVTRQWFEDFMKQIKNGEK